MVFVALVLFLTLPNMGETADLKKGSVACKSKSDLAKYQESDDAAKEEMLKEACMIAAEQVLGIHVSQTSGDYVLIAKSGHIPTMWTEKGNLDNWDDKDKYFYHRKDEVETK